MATEQSETERTIVEQLRAQALEQAAVTTLRAYGDELLGYLVGSLRDGEQAREVFSMFAEDLWIALPSLQLRTTMRAYCYALIRNASFRYLDRDLRKRRRGVPLSAALSLAVAHSRTGTAAHALSENKQRIAQLRERLSADERALLTLRIDRGLSWSEVAEAMGESQETSAAESDQRAAVTRCRKRYQLTKEKLKRWAREAGIVVDDV